MNIKQSASTEITFEEYKEKILSLVGKDIVHFFFDGDCACLNFIFSDETELRTNWAWYYWDTDNIQSDPSISSVYSKEESESDYDKRLLNFFKAQKFESIDLIRFNESRFQAKEDDVYCSIYFQDGQNLMCIANGGYWLRLTLQGKVIYEYIDGKFYKSKQKK